MDEAASHLRNCLLHLNEADVLVVTELEVLPLLLFGNFFAVNDFLYFLLLFVNLDDISPTKSLPVSMRPSSVLQDVVHGVDPVKRTLDEAVL